MLSPCPKYEIAEENFVLKELENAVVTHYCIYKLKLPSARTELIEDVIESYKKATFFFKLSPIELYSRH